MGKKNKRRKSDSLVDAKSNKDQPGIKFPEIKGSGVFLRSSKVNPPVDAVTCEEIQFILKRCQGVVKPI